MHHASLLSLSTVGVKVRQGHNEHNVSPSTHNLLTDTVWTYEAQHKAELQGINKHRQQLQ